MIIWIGVCGMYEVWIIWSLNGMTKGMWACVHGDEQIGSVLNGCDVI